MSEPSATTTPPDVNPLAARQRALVVSCALAAWAFAGVIMAVPPLVARPAVASMGVTDQALRGRWFSWYDSAFLMGAAVGGLAFGWLGDRVGRAKALGLSVVTYSAVAGACALVATPTQLLALWFLASTGVGGVWPNGVSLASEALPGVSRPWLAGLFGTAANLGLVLLAAIAYTRPISADHWRWVMLVAAAPVWLGVLTLAIVPESPAWFRRRTVASGIGRTRSPVAEVFRPPLLKYTAIGILLGTVPMMGNWGATNWLVPWASQVQEGGDNPRLSASTQWAKSAGATIGGLLGGWMASLYGRRLSYFLISALSLASSFYIFHWLTPLSEWFLAWVFVQGVFGTVYFGWLPLYLPELFPTRVRATGTGVTFNWGRVATAAGVLAGGQLMLHYGGDYARVGQITCLVYGLGMIAICFAPDTSRKSLEA